jgi:hypothetical protein
MGSIRIESKWLRLKPIIFLILWNVCVTYIHIQGSG